MRVSSRHEGRALDLTNQRHDGRRGDGGGVAQGGRQDGRGAGDDPRRLRGR